MLCDNDTIAAIATPAGIGALAIIRVSGPDAQAIVASCIEQKSRFMARAPWKTGVYALFDPSTKHPLDQVTIIKYAAPRSYTGQEMVEICCHGGTYAGKKIMETLIRLGARLARKGEFTQRALVSGKIGLVQAEALLEMIHAESQIKYRHALDGFLNAHISTFKQWQNEIINILTLVESSIEFPDEEDVLESSSVAKIFTRIRHVREAIESELHQYSRIKQSEKGIIIPIVGLKNAGKSSLFNALINEERAIVHPKAGTTRDALREKIEIGGIEATLIDTAGIGKAHEEIEAIGIQKAWEHIRMGHLALWVTAAGEGINAEEERLLHERAGKPTAAIVSKADIQDPEDKKKYLRACNIPSIAISCISQQGARDATEFMISQAKVLAAAFPEHSAFINARQQGIAKKMQQELKAMDRDRDYREETVAHRLKCLLGLLEEMTGAVTSQDILDGIFDRFCIGK
jgi:tRNA modification GTPase